MNLTVEQIAAACGARHDRAHDALPGLVEAMRLFEINTPVRAGMFLANIGHETGGLKWLHELWGPTPQQLRYERDFTAPWPATAAQAAHGMFVRNRLAFGLGNDQQGDGRRFAGGGHLHTTGRANYVRVRDRLRARFPELGVPDFEAFPEKLREHQWAALVAADYVGMTNANRFADAGDFDGYCDVINRGRKTAAQGDSNGWEHRLALWNAIGQGSAFA